MLFKSSRDVLLEHVDQVKRLVKLKTVDAKNASVLEQRLAKAATRHKFLGKLRIVSAILLYASVLSTFSSHLPILSEVLQTIVEIAGILGVGVLSLSTLYLSYRMREIYNRMVIYYSHLIAIYEKNNKNIYTDAVLPVEPDTYT